ncbi:MAG: hypothetical protein A3F46_06210 [Legionellales bacterium RIFCSPHIGHO2_12_FULL_42_9]|nr:MAG: hypothetical protein A3F46_06210 [Legionellales bacterium RIFCSPHIGHO2_12_FULL_42_9]
MKLFSLIVIICSFFPGYAMASDEKLIYGYVEKATLVEKNLILSAKLDTGAKSSSLSAINIQQFEKNGNTYLRFTVPSKTGNVEFVSEYVGRVKIKARAGERLIPSAKPEPIKRPVVLMRIQLGNKLRSIAVNLTNRKRFNYPLLLGRDAINLFDGLVDPSAAFKLKRQSTATHSVKKKNEIK